MNYNIKGTGVQISDELRAYVERQFVHTDKLLREGPAHADVELAHMPEGRSGKFRAEFTTEVGGAVHRASAWGSSLHEAIDLAGAELVAELRKSKSKRLHVLRHKALQVKEYLRGWRRKI